MNTLSPLPQEISPLLSACELPNAAYMRTSYPKGKLVGDSEGSDSRVVFIESGNVEVFSVSLDGKEVLISTLGDSDLFGVSNLFEEVELRTLLQCKTDCVFFSIAKSVLRQAILKHPQAVIEYGRLCNRKIQFLISRIEQLTLNSARLKIVEYLLTHTSVLQGELSFCSKEALALPLGISRATLFRELSILQELGAVENHGSSVFVLDRPKLENLLQK